MMALVIYPTVGYDSFITVAAATVVIDTVTLHTAVWSGLTVTEQEVYLRIALRRILDGIDLEVTPLPDPMLDCAGEAQALMAIQDLVYSISATQEADVGSIKKQKVASLEIEYYDTKTSTTTTVSIIPTMARACLGELGYNLTPAVSGLSQTTLGRA